MPESKSAALAICIHPRETGKSFLEECENVKGGKEKKKANAELATIYGRLLLISCGAGLEN